MQSDLFYSTIDYVLRFKFERQYYDNFNLLQLPAVSKSAFNKVETVQF